MDAHIEQHEFTKQVDALEKEGFKEHWEGLVLPTLRKKLLNGNHLCCDYDGRVWLQCSWCVLLFTATEAKQVIDLFKAMNY